MNKSRKVCKRCLKLMPINKNGQTVVKGDLCPTCLREEKKLKSIDWNKRKREFEEKIESIRGKCEYDGLVMLSGGKDSVYVAYLLAKVYNLRILAITIDNGFEYDSTFKNAGNIAQKLSISHLVYRLSAEDMKEYYKFLLTNEQIKEKDCSQLCFFCGRLLKSIAIKIAKQLNVAAVFSGHTAEQIRSLGDEKITDKESNLLKSIIKNKERKVYETAISCLDHEGKSNLKYLFEDNMALNNFENTIYPLDYFEYKPIEIIELLKKEVGWEADCNFSKKYISSGCKLSKLLEYVAASHDTDTYVEREFSDQIRRGSITKEEVKEILEGKVDSHNEVKELMEKLSITSEDIL